ncbi:RHS repeat-associated core domain-containing protein [Agarivorans aestuarii]|uniref:RHS repeat-associated core domain-containing protein n=1 Tax=Agarivorans aestuarii TaxID=1563703 RepID=UPI001C813B1D|nr:RHS repeat-associated core domain-containing protein [Agarivorans aestuarii]
MILGENSILARYGSVNDISHAYTNRGYTGHEMLAGVGLIHMNGRIYDADIGRFLQADPHVQAPNNAQNYNRYSYALNNPMSYTDPSGYFFSGLKKFFKKYWRSIVAAVVAVVSYGYASGWAMSWGFTSTTIISGSIAATSTTMSFGGYVVAGAIAGATSGFVATGTLRGAAYGALSGAVFGGIGASFRGSSGLLQRGGAGHVSAHAAAGGVLSKLQGGNFGHGFLSAGVMKGVGMYNASKVQNVMGSTLIQAAVGGTLSRITGGKFANGAVTSAIQYVVNEASNVSEAIKKNYISRTANGRIHAINVHKCASADCLLYNANWNSNDSAVVDYINDRARDIITDLGNVVSKASIFFPTSAVLYGTSLALGVEQAVYDQNYSGLAGYIFGWKYTTILQGAGVAKPLAGSAANVVADTISTNTNIDFSPED